MLATLERGRVPRRWRPLETTTDDEAVFLSPLDPVSARGRARQLFDFDYTWEVYTPPARRKRGYYALPVLAGTEIVGHVDPKADRESRRLRVISRRVRRGHPVSSALDHLARFLGLRR